MSLADLLRQMLDIQIHIKMFLFIMIGIRSGMLASRLCKLPHLLGGKQRKLGSACRLQRLSWGMVSWIMQLPLASSAIILWLLTP